MATNAGGYASKLMIHCHPKRSWFDVSQIRTVSEMDPYPIEVEIMVLQAAARYG